MRRIRVVATGFALLLSIPTGLQATAIPLIDARQIIGRYFNDTTTITRVVSPGEAFELFNASLQSSGAAMQHSFLNFAGDSFDGLAGTLKAAVESRLLSDYTSVLDITFRLDKDYGYSTDVGFDSHVAGASNWYVLDLYSLSTTGTLVFSQSGSPLNEAFSFRRSGTLGAGDYRFRLSLNAFHADRPFIVSSDISATFLFDLTPTAVPEGDFSLWPEVVFAALFFKYKQSRGRLLANKTVKELP
jgi:hypothetical protein